MIHANLLCFIQIWRFYARLLDFMLLLLSCRLRGLQLKPSWMNVNTLEDQEDNMENVNVINQVGGEATVDPVTSNQPSV